MGKTADTHVLNTGASVQEQNSVRSCFTIPGEYGYEWNLITDTITWMGNLYQKLGYKKNALPKTLKVWEDKMIHPLDRQRVKKARHQHLKTGNTFSTHYRVKQKNGEYIFLSAQGKATLNNQGTPYKWEGSIHLNPNKSR